MWCSHRHERGRGGKGLGGPAGCPEQVEGDPDPRGSVQAGLEVPRRPSLVVTWQDGGRAHDRSRARLCPALNASEGVPSDHMNGQRRAPCPGAPPWLLHSVQALRMRTACVHEDMLTGLAPLPCGRNEGGSGLRHWTKGAP